MNYELIKVAVMGMLTFLLINLCCSGRLIYLILHSKERGQFEWFIGYVFSGVLALVIAFVIVLELSN